MAEGIEHGAKRYRRRSELLIWRFIKIRVDG